MQDEALARSTRTLGLCGLSGALVMALGDLLMLGAPVSGMDAMHLQFDLMSALPWWRVRLGGLLGPVGACLLVGGAGFVWRLLKPGLLRTVAALGLGGLAVLSGAYHALFPLVRLLMAPQLVDLVDANPRVYLGMMTTVAALPGLPGGLALTLAIARRRADLPRWAALLTPVVTIPAMLLLGTLLPAPVGGPVVAAGFNLGIASFYAAALYASALYASALQASAGDTSDRARRRS